MQGATTAPSFVPSPSPGPPGRFGISGGQLPRMQQERQLESSAQARQAEILSQRFQDTEVQAERCVREEMDRTSAMERSIMERHPDWVNWQRRNGELQRSHNEWEREQQGKRSKAQHDLEVFQQQLRSRQEALANLQNEQAQCGERVGNLENKRAQLIIELEQARLGERDAQHQSETLRGQINPLEDSLKEKEAELARITARVDSIQPELQKVRHEFNALEDQKSQYERNISDLENQLRQTEERRFNAESNYNKAWNDVNESQGRIDEYRSVFDSFRVSQENNEEKKKRAQEVVSRTQGLQNQAAMLRQQHEQDYQKYDAENESFYNQRESIQKQIDKLIIEQQNIDWKVSENQLKQAKLEEEIRCLQNDEATAHGYHQDALDVLKDIENSSSSYQENYKRQQNLIESSIGQKNDAERRLKEAETQMKEGDRMSEVLRKREVEYASLYANLQNRITDSHSKVFTLESEQRSIHSFVDNLRNEISMIRNQQKTIQDEFTPVLRMLNNCRNQGELLSRQITEIERELQGLQLGPSGRIDVLVNEITEIQNRIRESRDIFGQGPQCNQYSAEFSQHQNLRPEVENRVRQSIRSNPPEELRMQLSREAEAVMRAELASGLVARQQQIEIEAKDLAGLRAATQAPKILMDEQATDRLLSEHLTVPNDYRRLASSIVELAEQRHIVKA